MFSANIHINNVIGVHIDHTTRRFRTRVVPSLSSNHSNPPSPTTHHRIHTVNVKNILYHILKSKQYTQYKTRCLGSPIPIPNWTVSNRARVGGKEYNVLACTSDHIPFTIIYISIQCNWYGGCVSMEHVMNALARGLPVGR